MKTLARSVLTALAVLSTLAAPAAAQTADSPIRVVVLAQPGDQVLLFLAPDLAAPIALQGFEGLFALDAGRTICVPGAPVDAGGVSETPLPRAGFAGWLAIYLQAGIVSPRDPASGQIAGPRGRLLRPVRLPF